MQLVLYFGEQRVCFPLVYTILALITFGGGFIFVYFVATTQWVLYVENVNLSTIPLQFNGLVSYLIL